ncbi:MAG: hypothetical protein COA37_06425 [Hoeflea sp.]|uniref:DUF2971 domain-containing protein n=1 Tax=Hoeflea sp. TaxID=1940281 RepID=UPI000C11D2CE|nr:DUF2971 domain-containing protein [Hoeflea sp.]PHR24364.1 MAG: hypothetical protein COA37_06425 [Hoeflea sp.]
MRLYHYCSVQSAHSILTSKKVRLSSLTHSNDFMEGQWSLEMVKKILQRIASERNLSPYAARLAVLGLELQLNNYDALGLCLSEKGDVLSQWRGYAHDGTGFSIGFSDEAIDSWKRSRTFKKVIYEESEQVELLQPFVERLVQAVENGIFQGPEDARSGGLGEPQLSEEQRQERRDQAAHSYASTGADMLEEQFSLKNPAFSEEQEWRLITFKERTYEGCEFYASATKIVPYLEFDLPDVQHSHVDHVILGPKNTIPVETVSAMLKTLGYNDVNVEPSLASYR